MRNPPPEIENDRVQRLIAGETDGALAKFRKIDFEANVRKRIGKNTAKKSGISFGRILPIPVWVAIAAALLVAGIVVVPVFQKTKRPNIAQTIEAVLGQTDGFLARRYNVIERSQPDGDVGLAAGNNFLAALLKNAPSGQNHALPSPPLAKTPRVQPLRLEEIYKILFIDKAIEHVLTLITS